MTGDDTLSKSANFTALVVEDEVLIAFTMLDCLNDLGAAEVVVAHDLATALQHLAERQFDVAVVDWILGKQTSDPIVQAMNDVGRLVVIATGLHAEAVPEPIRERNTIIYKPFQIETFNEAIVGSLSGRCG
ncbi:MAG: hypothetical protein K2P80_08465 [Beijerinckiaceae bacterium]|nr:hypothetical protein [Beijerinckiaceae bacterium]